ncbi:MAG: fuconate dehydratase [Pedosphaera sp.]|nr:fuconate dehydratase [Pedosphaera sp.]
MSTATITRAEIIDLRFPTSEEQHGSDAVHVDPDYSAAYVVLHTDAPIAGHGLTFTIGRGNEIVCQAIESLSTLVVGKTLADIAKDRRAFWRSLAQDSQFRWLGPEKGVMQLALAALVNAVWDLEARLANKPLWKLLAEMPAETLVAATDFHGIRDAVDETAMLAMLHANDATRAERIARVEREGFPAYTTSCGWIGYSDDVVRARCREAITEGFTHFKMKIGQSIADDVRRARIIREEIGPDRVLMVDANQRFDVREAIEWIKPLAPFGIWWFEEPVSPDDILGHAEIARSIAPIKVATGEQCQNRVMFKQFLASGGMQICQLDSCRVGGVNDNLAIMALARRYDVPVCPHAGGVGLCELVAHLVLVDYIRFNPTMEGRVCEFVDHLHEHFVDPCVIQRGRYCAPTKPGYSSEIKRESLRAFAFPDGPEWTRRAIFRGKGIA